MNHNISDVYKRQPLGVLPLTVSVKGGADAKQREDKQQKAGVLFHSTTMDKIQMPMIRAAPVQIKTIFLTVPGSMCSFVAFV